MENEGACDGIVNDAWREYGGVYDGIMTDFRKELVIGACGNN